MRRIDKYAFLYLLALVPLSAVAIVWTTNSSPKERVDIVLIFFSLLSVGTVAYLRLHIAFRRYKADYNSSREQVDRERSKLSEKHVSELKHYIGELEKSSLALRHSREKYRYAAYHDLLTGLPNRNKLIGVINRL